MSTNYNKYPFLILQADEIDFQDFTKKYNNRDPEKLEKVKKYFYSDENIQNIQKLLIKNVYLKSGKKYKIPPQKKSDLIQVMKNYFEYSEIIEYQDEATQISKLNREIVNDLTDEIITEIGLYKKHQRELFYTPDPLEYPKYISNRDKKILPSWMQFGV